MKGNGTWAIKNRLAALDRALAAKDLMQDVTLGSSIDWTFFAAIGIRETGFQNIEQGLIKQNGTWVQGGGRGVFQIDITKNPGVSEDLAMDITWAAGWMASYLRNSASRITTAFPDLPAGSQFDAILGASWNKGVTGAIRDYRQNKISSYGTNISNLMDCFVD
jgi:hypothetical protein